MAPRSKGSLLEYISAEVTRGYQLELDEERFQARREKMYMFMTIPHELERLMGYGFFQCADAFLFLFTYLPLRVAFKLFTYISHFLTNLVKRKLPLSSTEKNASAFNIKQADRCNFLKLGIFFVSVYLFTLIDTSVLYHIIKSQSVIKLYIFFNMLEVGDRLFASFVQDTIDALLLTATQECPKKSKGGSNKWGLTTHIILTLSAVFGHALVILLQGTTLSVAINASNRALLTVMMSNNFVELKGAVFKKFDKINLFQVSCSDIRERFHLCVLLLVVCLQTMREYSWEESRFWVLFPDCMMVLLAEIGVDWVKHAFITRFNELPAEVYREYTLSLAYDLAQTKQRKAFSDHADMVGRRLGFVPLPLAVVLARVLRPCFSNGHIGTIVLTIMGFFALATFRTLNSIILLGKACDLIDQHVQSQSTTSLSPTHTTTTTLIASSFSAPVQFTEAIKNEPCSSGGSGENEFDFERTRTPSPLLNHDELSDLKKLTNKVKPGHAQRSFSASHTPRPSIGSINELPVLPPLVHSEYHNDVKLLEYNSLVRILSVSFNEEMIANENVKEPEKNTGGKLTRKHSLGSNLMDSEDVLSKQNIDNNDSSIQIKTEPPDTYEHNVFGSSPETSILEQTAVELQKLKLEQESESSDELLLNSMEAERIASSVDKILGPASDNDINTMSTSSTPENILNSPSTEVRQRVKKKSITGWFKEQIGSSSSHNNN